MGRQLGGDPAQIAAALDQAQLVLLGTGFQGSVAPQVEAFNSAIRHSGRFALRQSWPKPLGGRFELWVRRPQAPPGPSFSLGLLAVLQNRPLEADRWFARLETLNPASPWPVAYRAVVLNAAWRPWQARAVADLGQRRSPHPVLRGLGDLSGVLGGQLWRIGSARQSIPAACRAVEAALQPKPGPDG